LRHALAGEVDRANLVIVALGQAVANADAKPGAVVKLVAAFG
jgi:hypothetical protein